MKRKPSGPAFWDNPDDPRHGTLNGGSNLRCKCPPCHEAYRAYQDAYTARLREARSSRPRRSRSDPISPRLIARRDDPSDPAHGTPSGYNHLRCSCDRCQNYMRAVWRAGYRDTSDLAQLVAAAEDDYDAIMKAMGRE